MIKLLFLVCRIYCILISGQCFGFDPGIVKEIALYQWPEMVKERTRYSTSLDKGIRPWFCFVPYGYEERAAYTPKRCSFSLAWQLLMGLYQETWAIM